MTKVVSIQYPSGSFGHLIHTLLSSYSPQFYGEPLNYTFGHGGDSHQYPLFLPKYIEPVTFNTVDYTNCLKQYQGQSEFISILIDSGIDNDSDEFVNYINPDIRLKVNYNKWSWPIAGKLFYTRCMSAVLNKPTELNEFISPDIFKWNNVTEEWAIREKYFLFLRDHAFNQAWQLHDSELSIPLIDILDYNSLFKRLSMYFTITEFKEFYNNWQATNYRHYGFYNEVTDIWDKIKNKIPYSLSGVSDLFTQAVIYYFIWLEYGVEVPHNDYSHWFTNTDEIVTMLNKCGATV